MTPFWTGLFLGFSLGVFGVITERVIREMRRQHGGDKT